MYGLVVRFRSVSNGHCFVVSDCWAAYCWRLSNGPDYARLPRLVYNTMYEERPIILEGTRRLTRDLQI